MYSVKDTTVIEGGNTYKISTQGTITKTVDPSGYGTISGDESYTYSLSAQTKSFTASPESGKKFTSWSSTVGSWSSTTANPATLTIPASNVGAITVTSTFEDDITYLPVGGRIFYIHSDNGATYKFFDANKNEITTITVAGLANAKYYAIVSGTPSADKFYVYDSTNGLATDKQWGKYGTSIGVTSDGIGLGKTNTATCLAQSDWESDSIFTYVQSVNTAQIGGCNDWFIGSNAEQDQLRSSGLVNWYSSRFIWSSVEYSYDIAYSWDYSSSYWYGHAFKYSKFCVVPLRAF